MIGLIDFSAFDLRNSIARHDQKAMLEASALDSSMRKESMKAALDGLAHEYNIIDNSRVSKIINKRRIIESATISAVKDVVYNIFEGALLIDDEPKAYYSKVLKEVFEGEFNKLLTENSITTLNDFNKHFGKSTRLLEATINTASTLTRNNGELYSELLESYYGDLGVRRGILDTFKIMIEADASADAKKEKFTKSLTALKNKLLDADVNSIIKYGVDLKVLLIALGVGIGVPVVMMIPVIGLAIGVVSVFLSYVYLIAKDVHDAKADNLTKYMNEVKDIKQALVKLSAKVPKDSKEYMKLKSRIVRCDSAIDHLTASVATIKRDTDLAAEKKKAKENRKKNLAESSVEAALTLIMECEDAKLEAITDNVNNFVTTLKDAIPELKSSDNDGTIILLDSMAKDKLVTESGTLDTSKVMSIACLLYEASTFSKPGKITEGAHKKLLEGELPDEEEFLDPDEQEMLDTVSKLNGKDIAIDKIKDKVISVIENEEKRVKEKEEEQQAALNKMSSDDINAVKDTINESVGFKLGSTRLNMPETLFEAIVMNRSKKYLQEASTEDGKTIDLLANKENILSESIVLYTIHETFNTLNLRKYDYETNHKFMNQYYYNKI